MKECRSLISVLLLAVLSASSALAAAKKSSEYCKLNSGVEFVDTSIPVSEDFLTKMKQVGVAIVGRYYDYPDETIPLKRLRKAELKLLEDKAMNVVVVFQHWNNKAKTFIDWKSRGPGDANEALKLAADFKQPDGSAIYFGVDADLVGKSSKKYKFYTAEVLAYFGEINRIFKEKSVNYKIGVYGSGAACKELRSSGLVTYCWLSHSHGFYGTKQALADMAYDIEQYLPGVCHHDIDFGKLKPGVTDIGQFPAKSVP
jgi:hypothetical protein